MIKVSETSRLEVYGHRLICAVIYRSFNSDRHYTFKDVKQAATAFGEGLCNLWDWQRGDVLNIYAPNDIDVAPIVFGTFFAGGIVSPANPTYSAAELAFQLENSESKAIVTTKAFLKNALAAAKKANIPEDRIILLGEARDDTHRVKHWSNIRKTSGALRYRRRKMHPVNDLAFLVYSSGTTGLPKGVRLNHRNIVANLCQIAGSATGKELTSKDKLLGVLPFFHIYGLTMLLHQVLHRGIELIVMPGFELKGFLSTIQKHKITFINVAPPILVRLARDEIVSQYDLSSIRMLTSGAAPLTDDLIKQIKQRLNIRVTQAYGLSECSPGTHVQRWEEWESSIGSVGVLVPNMVAKFMSPEGKELPPDQPGELWVSGPNIFQGYWKNDAATADCLTVVDGVTYFKTGDVGRLDTAHNFFITDRVKELIKYKGFQVAPAELEGKLMAHPLINDVAVIGVQDRRNHTEMPRAYIVHARLGGKAGDAETGFPAGEEAKRDADAITKWLSEQVADHKKLRGGIRFIPEIPKSGTGKILRRVLKDRVKAEEAAEENKAKL
jgi:acyl-CoA synthetase (AMP-forming)/AMP-acid ligase II